MRRALELARVGTGSTRPNPLVGAVVVDDGHIVGEGYHAIAGGPHAEIEALRATGDRARGATMYVTLEPCNHHGRTPPCTQAILDAGVERVYFAARDPNPNVGGHGAKFLRENGVECIYGPRSDEAIELNRGFFHWIRTGCPWVIAKFAASLDGRIATRTGESKWITGPESRRRAHELRREVDAILVGVGTVLDDDPVLTVRLLDSWERTGDRKQRAANSKRASGSSPLAADVATGILRIVLDSRGRSPVHSKVFARFGDAQTLVATTEASSPRWRHALQEMGVDIALIPPTDDGRVDISELADELGRRKIRSVLVEGGATVHGSFFDQGLVNEVWAFLAPMVIGGIEAPGAVAGSGPATLSNALRLASACVERLGDDVLIRGIVPKSRAEASGRGNQQLAISN